MAWLVTMHRWTIQRLQRSGSKKLWNLETISQKRWSNGASTNFVTKQALFPKDVYRHLQSSTMETSSSQTLHYLLISSLRYKTRSNYLRQASLNIKGIGIPVLARRYGTWCTHPYFLLSMVARAFWIMVKSLAWKSVLAVADKEVSSKFRLNINAWRVTPYQGFMRTLANTHIVENFNGYLAKLIYLKANLGKSTSCNQMIVGPYVHPVS